MPGKRGKNEPTNKNGLTEMRQKFAELVALLDENGKPRTLTDAFIQAGYGPNSNRHTQLVDASRLAKVPTIAAEIARLRELQEEIFKQQASVTVGRIVAQIASVAFDADAAKTADQLRALELLGKHKGMFTEKLSVSYDLSNLSDEELTTLERIHSKLGGNPARKG